MIVGDPHVFAVECEPDIASGDNHSGRICVWLGGQRIGDFSQHVLLGSLSGQLHASLFSLGWCHDRRLQDTPAAECFAILSAEVFGDVPDAISGNVEGRAISDIDCVGMYRWLDGPPFTEGFRSWIMDMPRGQRLIWKEWGEATVHETHLPPGIYAAVVRGFIEWLESEVGVKHSEPGFVRVGISAMLKAGRKALTERGRDATPG